MAKRANGTGTVRKVSRTINGKKYEYWKARYTDGVDLGTGKQRRRSITGRTQKEIMQKLKAVTAAQDSGTYIAPNKQTLGQWLDIWEKTYLGGVKPRTRQIYADNIRLHIKPALGLTWDCVDFKAGAITVSKQALLHETEEGGGFKLGSTKNGRSRNITPATAVMVLLKQHKREQAQQRLRVGKLWTNDKLVFTDEIGRPLTKSTVYRAFKKVAEEIGRPDARFHNLRHSYATAALRAGDDIKTVQNALGHATAAFTLDVYGHVTEEMKRESAARMDAYIKTVSR